MTATPAPSATEVEPYGELLARLSRLSVTRHFDAYGDIDWDAAEMQIDPADPRWQLDRLDPLGATAWYQAQPATVRSNLGLHRIAGNMKVGLQFESVLKRGLLEYATTLVNGDPEFRYVYHEVIEEAQHSLMFQEFVNRTGFDVAGMPWPLPICAREVVKLGRRFPELFLLFVLAGEDPIDFAQREALRCGRELPPILERIIRVHVTEEARHLSFARHCLRRRVRDLSRMRRQELVVATPVLLGAMAAVMLLPSPQLVRTYHIPYRVLRTAYFGAGGSQYLADSVAKVRDLAVELGIVTAPSRPLWRAFGLWDCA